MTRVVVTEAAAAELRTLIRSHRLPADTIERVQRSLRALEDFPELGAPLGSPFDGRRFLLGPWRWMIMVYGFDTDEETVAILAIVDWRTSGSPLANR